ncbi:hypothetical protein SAMN02745702_00263 [Desulfobaculum bizertense DSM 18034]|uniref:Uncharacterized protein n=1 Tax=Desulfobaculum bizertense DSM 18034 TaxID=1121442 RepID=A0A1T4VGL8_9BACT|nr:hypothetical protein SAMN02745702_00263 [Desulfobaculum bizertense DSM 18034]
MSYNIMQNAAQPDPISELFRAASALRFIEDALNSADCLPAPSPEGLSCLSGLLAQQLSTLATELWETEDARPFFTPPCPRRSRHKAYARMRTCRTRRRPLAHRSVPPHQ